MTRPLHVLQVVHNLNVGGTERLVKDLVGHFNDGEFRTSVCCLDSLGPYGEELQQAGIAVDVLGRRPGLDLPLARQLGRLCRERGIDVVHAHQYTPYVYAATACLLRPAARVVFTEHGRHQPDRLRIRRAVANQVLRAVTAAYTAVCEFTRDSLVAFERMPRSQIKVIYNGMALDEEAERPTRDAARRALDLAADARIVLTVGRMDRIKDFATLIRAMATIAAEMPDATLLVAGGGDPDYQAELAALVESLKLRGRVHLLGTRRDVPTLLAACDVFALTSLTEAASMIILEAMAAGRPIVATNVGGNGELVADDHTGLLVPVGDVTAVAAALRRLLTDGERARAMGAAGRQRLAERFGRSDMFARYRQVYREAVSR